MISDILQLEKSALGELAQAKTQEAILAVRTKYLGRKGLLTGLLRNIAQVPADEKPLFGKRCNEVKELLEVKIEEALKFQAQGKKEAILSKEKIDVTLPGRSIPRAGFTRLFKYAVKFVKSLPRSVFQLWKGRKSSWIITTLNR